jgi:cobalt-precorrin 5A hydrolase
MHPTATLWVGLGCRQGTPLPLFEQSLRRVCRLYSIDWMAIAGLATIDAKQTEPGLLAFSLAQNWPLIYFTQAQLERYTVPNPSVVVKAAVGVSSVCEAAALRAAAQASSAMWSTLIVPKQVFRGSQALGSVTVAIAMPHPQNLYNTSA